MHTTYTLKLGEDVILNGVTISGDGTVTTPDGITLTPGTWRIFPEEGDGRAWVGAVTVSDDGRISEVHSRSLAVADFGPCRFHTVVPTTVAELLNVHTLMAETALGLKVPCPLCMHDHEPGEDTLKVGNATLAQFLKGSGDRFLKILDAILKMDNEDLQGALKNLGFTGVEEMMQAKARLENVIKLGLERQAAQSDTSAEGQKDPSP